MEASSIPSDAAERVAALKLQLEQAEAEENATIASPAVTISVPAPADTPPTAAPPAPPEVSPEAAQSLPGGAAAAIPAAESAPGAPAEAAPEVSLTPVLDALKSASETGFIGKLREVAVRLLDEGKIVEADLFTPSEEAAVTSTLVKAVGELITKVGL